MAVAVTYLTPGDDLWPNGANNSGNDAIGGADGNDTLVGGAGGDIFQGGDGYDTVSYRAATVGINLALAGNDGFGDNSFGSVERILFSEFGDTFSALGFSSGVSLYGYGGADSLVGDGGNDLLTGGAGADAFLFYSNLTGADRIADFENGVDHITFSGVAGVDDFSDLSIVTSTGGARVVLPDGSTITLTGVTVGQIDASDFIFGP